MNAFGTSAKTKKTSMPPARAPAAASSYAARLTPCPSFFSREKLSQSTCLAGPRGRAAGNRYRPEALVGAQFVVLASLSPSFINNDSFYILFTNIL